jgi:GAF domain-containing protein
MKKRSKAGGKPAKALPRKTLKLKGRAASKAVTRRGSAPAGQTEVVRLTRELNEAQEQQAATTDLLEGISQSAFNLQVVLDTLVQSAARLCEAEMASLVHPEGSVYRFLASYGYPQQLIEFMETHPVGLGRGTVTGRTVIERKPVQIPDVLADPEFTFREGVKIGGMRTMLGVPLLRDGVPIGVFILSRSAVRPFSDKQIELVQNFAAQAVIAIENARLLNELRQSLQQQTATSEVLQAISTSPGELEPVFTTMLEKAVSICDAGFGNIYRWDGKDLHLVAAYNTPPAFTKVRARLPNPAEGPIGRMVATKSVVHVPDLKTERIYLEQRVPAAVDAVELGGVRTFLSVPMLKDGELVGAILLNRPEVRPFSNEQIALVKNFAAQAVIAIENARLLDELRKRTIDLTESLEQQTAMAEVLRIISSSPNDLVPVFESVLANATRLCEANFGILHQFDGKTFHIEVAQGLTPEYAAVIGRTPQTPDPRNTLGRLLQTREPVHVADLTLEQAYLEREPIRVAVIELGGARTLLAVPLLKDNKVIGAIVIFRKEVRPFTDKQIELVKNFASQAVIAIENARLLKELHQRTEEVVKLNQHLEQRVTDQVGEIERFARLRRFLPPQVADLIVASGTEKQLESHRREITALFCDLRGFTGFSEASAPEDVMALLRDYHAAIGEIIIKYSGTLERYAGDGVMVVFNDPVPVDNPALRAVQMALETRAAMAALTERWRQLGHDVGFGIGIAHGYATLGTIGFEGRFDYAAIGTVSNVASRLCDEAKPGQILISPRVFMAVKDAVTVEPVGEFTLKGIGRPLAAYNVLAATSASGD